MIKKVLLIVAALILAISCSEPPTDPNNNGNNTGNGNNNGNGGNTIITDPNKISEFLQNHEGRYYNELENYTTFFRVENGKIYASAETTELPLDKMTLSGNKIKLEYEGNDANKESSSMTVFNFINDTLQVNTFPIYKKEAFSIPQNYVEVPNITASASYTGNYYNWSEGSSGKDKYYFISIDSNGKIYVSKDSNKIFELNGNILSVTETVSEGNSKYEYIIENDKLVGDKIFLNGSEYYLINIKKSDLLTPYAGTYSGEGTTLTVSEIDAVISSITITGAILNGVTLTLYETSGTKHTIVFNNDKTKATYTKPDNTIVTLTKQIA